MRRRFGRSELKAVRVMATKAILSLDPEESAAALLPLLNDKDEFVRREAAYALGLTRSRSATASLTDRLLNDKDAGVRGAAAVALGRIGDENAVLALAPAMVAPIQAPPPADTTVQIDAPFRASAFPKAAAVVPSGPPVAVPKSTTTQAPVLVEPQPAKKNEAPEIARSDPSPLPSPPADGDRRDPQSQPSAPSAPRKPRSAPCSASWR